MHVQLSADESACPWPGAVRDNNNKVIWYGRRHGRRHPGMGDRHEGVSDPSRRAAHSSLPPDQPPLTQVSLPPTTPFNLPSPKGPGGPGGGTTARLRSGFNLPPPGETHFVRDEVMLDIPSRVLEPTLDLIAARHSMTRLETRTFRLTGRTLHRWRLDGGGTVAAMIRGLAGEQQVAGAQPIYLHAMAQDPPPVNSDQYAPEKLNLPEAHRLATGNRVLVAMTDSGVDASHPDLAGAIVANFDSATGDTTPHPHGTGMAGAHAARRTVLSTAPGAGLLTVRASSVKAHNGEGTTFNIIKD